MTVNAISPKREFSAADEFHYNRSSPIRWVTSHLLRYKPFLTSFIIASILDLKTIAISRLLLDNFAHIKAYWIMLGVKIAQTALYFGADDLDGTVMEERIGHMAGASSAEALTPEELQTLILAAGREPVQRDTFFKPVKPRADAVSG